ncbi:MAG: hypothetical protein AAGC44_14495 [Planctomycetota bacterium]
MPASTRAQTATEVDGTPLDSRTRRAWAGNYREYARYIAIFEEGYIVVPGYERRANSSRGMSVREAEERLKVTWTEDGGLILQDRTWRPPREEIEAYAKLLPALRLGVFGYVHSVEVVEILGPEEMLVKDLWILDADALDRQYRRDQAEGRASRDRNYTQLLEAAYSKRLELADLQDEREFQETFRLVGYRTRGLREGVRFDGLDDEGFQVAFVSWDMPAEEDQQDNRLRRSRRGEGVRVLADPAKVMRHTIDEQEFIELLKQKEMTIAGFVNLVRGARQQDRDTADSVILSELMPAGPNDEDD